MPIPEVFWQFMSDGQALKMGTRPLRSELIIHEDPMLYHHEIALKRALLHSAPDIYETFPAATLPAQWDAVDLLLAHLVQHRPPLGELIEIDGVRHWRHAWTGARIAWPTDQAQRETMAQESDDAAPVGLSGFGQPARGSPLSWLGRQLQEDLLLLADDAARGYPLIGGQLCFPNAWELREKLGQSILAIHDPVPRFAESLGKPMVGLMRQLKVDQPVWRWNWAIKATARLNLLPRYADETNAQIARLRAATVGARCYLRVERQVLARLPATGVILFVIHTYQSPLGEVAREPERLARLARALRTMPMEMLEYKGIAGFMAELSAWMGSMMAPN